MPAKRIEMRKIREVVRLHAAGISQREIGRVTGVSASTVGDLLGRVVVAGLTWPLSEDIDDEQLETLLYPANPCGRGKIVPPDWSYIHRELRRKHMTLMLLWQEYKVAHPEDGYQYSHFCEKYQRFAKKADVSMRQVHVAGEKAFVDWSGDGITITDPVTGKERRAGVFVGVLGASDYTYVEAASSEGLRDWIQSHIHMYEHFGGVPALTIPDNTKTAVTAPDRYEPELQATYLDMARHYGTAVLPARVRKPKDKAKVECAVLLVQRWILAPLRNHRFFSLEEANDAIWRCMDELNAAPFQKMDGSRLELWETLDRPALKPLPPTRYEYAEWRRCKVNMDYHLEVDKHLYSVPYQLKHEHVDVRVTQTTVEIFFNGERKCTHPRSLGHGFTTEPAHMPKAHQEYADFTPSRIMSWASETGPNTVKVVETIIARRDHPEQGYRSCLGIMRLGRTYGKERVEAACGRAVVLGAYGYRHISSMLKSGMDGQPLPGANTERKTSAPADHANIRGPGYYK
ncbi:MAG TPA: IS21 family transposase [Myxococcota bacterium]|nr:IS21 family transposase [Myxococcota bacterium]